MASITPILGTDSLSSSRIVLNNNFESIKTELADVAALLNTTTQTLQLTGAITTSRISVVNGSSNLFLVNSTDIISTVQHTFEDDVIFEAGVIGSYDGTIASPVSTLPTTGNWSRETYFVATSLTPYVISAGLEGQKITLIAANGSIILDNALIAGEDVDVTIESNKTISLRYLGSYWYVLSKN